MDEQLFAVIFGLSHRSAIADAFGIILARYLPHVLVLGFFVLLFREQGWRRKLFFFIQAAIATLLSRGIATEAIRFFYDRPRPFEALEISSLFIASGGSFPSGHAAFFFALAVAVFFMNRKWGLWYFVLAIVNGVARVLAGVHYPTDILGGALVGVLAGIIIRKLLAPQEPIFHEDSAGKKTLQGGVSA